jgi:aspartate aminotransferase
MKISQRVRNIEESKTTGLMDLVQQMQAAGTEVISFNAGEPDFNAPEPILKATIEALKAGKTKYSAVPGLPALRKAIAAKVHTENGIQAEAANILVANGSKQILYNVFQAICDPGDEVIIPSPYWVTFPEIVKLADGVPVFVETQNHQLDLAAIEAAITPRTCAILINSPNNPTGAVFPEADLRAVGQLALKHDLYVVSDEAYAGLTYDGTQHISMAALDPAFASRVITTQSFSKDYCMTGFRVGFLVADKALVKAINGLHSHLTGNVCTFAQYGALAALEMDPAIMASMQETFQRRLDLAYPLCTEIFPCVRPQGAFYLFPDVRAYLGERFADDDALAEYLLKEAHVAVVPGSSFGAPGFLRISFSTSEDNIRAGFARIKQALVV